MLFLISIACYTPQELASKVEFQRRFRLLPSGQFEMGGVEGDVDARPIHPQVLQHEFWVMAQEVDQELYHHIMGKNPSQNQNPSHPVDNVSWLDAVQFANALSEQNGLEKCYTVNETGDVFWPKGYDCAGFRLLSEVEWEYAARAGQSYGYAGSSDANRVGWTSFNAQESHPVSLLKPNAFGLYDMTGNVAEWVWDAYGEYPNQLNLYPSGIEGRNRVSRGCGWADRLDLCLVFQRFTDGYEWRFAWVGFRLAQSKIQ